jgi:hypothetical protein
MKKILSILITISLTIGVIVTPALALGNTTSGGVNVKNNTTDKKAATALENSLKKAQNQLINLTNDKSKLEATIQSAIDKAITTGGKKVATAKNQSMSLTDSLQKIQAELDKAAAQDKIEIENLNNDIEKWTDMTKKQQDALNNQLVVIDANLKQQLAELDKKLAIAKDDATKQNLATAKTNVQKYASQRKEAINAYLSSINGIFADRQKIWDERKALLAKRQAADAAYHTAISNIRTTELNDKLATLSQVQVDPNDVIEKTVRARYQKNLDAINSKIDSVNSIIKDLQTKLNK